jgi:methionyl-tRNA formyltransferase
MKIIIAGSFSPAIRALEFLFQEGLRPNEIRLLTHEIKNNRFLIEYAKNNNIAYSTLSVKTHRCFEWIGEFDADVIFSVYFRDIFPKAIIDLPIMGCVNLHPSLLPLYRGTFSAPWAILNNEKLTGISYHYITEKIDTGNLICQQKVLIKKTDTAFSLYYRLINKGLSHFPKVFDLVTRKRIKGEPQKGRSSYYSRKAPFNGFVDINWDIKQVDRFIRAMYFPPPKGACVILKNGETRELKSIFEYCQLLENGKL